MLLLVRVSASIKFLIVLELVLIRLLVIALIVVLVVVHTRSLSLHLSVYNDSRLNEYSHFILHSIIIQIFKYSIINLSDKSS